jgi:DNA-binding NtrC family response regulator
MDSAQNAHHHGMANGNCRLRSPACPPRFVTGDPGMQKVLGLVAHVAHTDATVLIVGESGTGKELIAHELHQQSSRRDGPFLAVNCGAIPELLQETELFGHRRGAFTGAVVDRIGKFEAADGGTLFLDEISEMKPGLQVTLLRILQHGEYAPVGLAENRYGDVRVIAATNCDPAPLIDSGRFRRDLYYRLNLIRIELPPLRERPGDIGLLADHFLHAFRAAHHKPNLGIHAGAKEWLGQYDFPGNVRELENIMRRAVILCRGAEIGVGDLPPEVRDARRTPAGKLADTFHRAKARAIEEFEHAYLVAALTACAGIVSRAARRAGLSERYFHEKLRKYGISSRDFRPGMSAEG